MPASEYNSAFEFLFNFRKNAERQEFYFRHFGNALTLAATFMKPSLRDTLFVTAIILVFASFLFFGTNRDDQIRLLEFATFATGVLYLVILFSKETKRKKLTWSIVLLSAAITLFLVRPFLIKSSYRIFISKNSQLLSETNKILTSTNKEIFIATDNTHRSTLGLDDFSTGDSLIIENFLRESGVNLIKKDGEKVFYRTTGIADESRGIYYLSSLSAQQKYYARIQSSWYY